MPVLCHHLPTARWQSLPPPAVTVAEVACHELGGAIAPLLTRCRGHGGFVPRALRGSVLSDGRSQCRGWVATTETAVAVAAIRLCGRGVGSRTRWSIPCVLVDPQFRRGGLAAGLVREALAAAKRQGATEVFVETLSSWEAATAFWAAMARRLAD